MKTDVIMWAILLVVSLVGLLFRDFLAREMQFVAHLWDEKVDTESEPYLIFKIYVSVVLIIFAIISLVLLLKGILSV